MTDLIRREDAIAYIERVINSGLGRSKSLDYIHKYISALPSADAEGEDLVIKGAKGIQDGLYNIKDGKLFKYKANGGTVRTYPIIPSADAVQGEWIKHKGEWVDLDFYPTKYECSQCLYYVDEGHDSIFCPNCGARMKGGAKRIKEVNPNVIVIPCDAEVVSADAVQGWRIGKPTEQGEYMVTLDSFGHKRIDLFFYGKPLMPNRKVRGKCWYRSDDEWGDVVYDDTDILAWQPLPKPYKGGEDE